MKRGRGWTDLPEEGISYRGGGAAINYQPPPTDDGVNCSAAEPKARPQ